MKAIKLHEIAYHDHLVLIDAQHNKLILLNPVATHIWISLREGMETGEISRELASVYGISTAIACQDVSATVDTWLGAGLLAVEGQDQTIATTQETNRYEELFNPTTSVRLAQPIQRYYRMGDHIICIRYYIKDIFDLIHTKLSHFETESRSINHQYDIDLDNAHYVVKCNGKILVTDSGADIIMSDLYESILEYVYPGMEMLALIHAAAMGAGDNAVIFPAISGSGKSTLSAGLMSAGFEYLGDDLVPIRYSDRNIAPFLTTLSIKNGSWDLIGRLFPELQSGEEYFRLGRHMRYLNVPESNMGEALCREVSHIIFPRYSASDPELLQEITPADALSRLVDDGVWIGYPLQPGRVKEFLEWLEQKSLYSMTYQSLQQAIEWTKELTANDQV